MTPSQGFLVLAMLLPFSSWAQTWVNLDFESLCADSPTGLCGWERSWGRVDSCAPERSERGQYLVIRGDSDHAVGFVEQTAKVSDAQSLAVVDVYAEIRSQDIVGKGAGLNVGVYDADDQLLFTRDMGYGTFGWVQGTSQWKTFHVSAICPPNAAELKVGAILYGQGRALFDNFRVTLTPTSGRVASARASAYIGAACDIIASRSLVRDAIDLPKMRTTALQIAGPAVDDDGCYLAVQYLLECLRPLGDEHSFFMAADDVRDWEQDDSEAAGIQVAEWRVVDGCGYILVPPFHGGNPKLKLAYADAIQTALRELDERGVRGWVVDLRQNTGGNMEPMIAGLGPLFDTEHLGSLVDVDGNKESWFYKDGSYGWDGEVLLRVTAPVTLQRRPIAVLIGPRTGSSGEIVVLSFVGNRDTRFFGLPTWGLTTGNGAFGLPDGARIMLASTVMADRHGKLYHGPVSPGVLVDEGGDDAAVQAAVNWILGQLQEAE